MTDVNEDVESADGPPLESSPASAVLSGSVGAGPAVADPSVADPSVAPTARIRVDLAYDGGGFSGWAEQPGRRTVQDELQQALARVLRQERVALTVAGRTDAGVHASGQVSHFDIDEPTWLEASPMLLRRLNGVLPDDIRVHAVTRMPLDFDARFSGTWRRYRYRICDTVEGADPLRRGFVLHWRRRVDVDAMHAAATRLVGEHDFAAFCRFREGATSIRELQTFTVRRDAEVPSEILCELKADAFCHSMVRSLVGALLTVGEGRQTAEWPAGLLSRTSRADNVPVVAPHGLVLVEVGYPEDQDFAARNATTRNVRHR